MGLKVVKFGGTSLASAEAFRKVKNIIEQDPNRRYVVPSAPGKRFSDDTKVTDLLYQCYEAVSNGQPYDHIFNAIKERYTSIVTGLELDYDIVCHLDHVYKTLPSTVTPDYAASRGEYLNGLLLAAYLGVPFVDAANVIFFNAQGQLDMAKTEAAIKEKLADYPRAVIPGFYGSLPNGEIKTFSRGGSDITGALVARAVNAAMYENWTDVSGIYMADPRIISQPKEISHITYSELRELAYAGANVLHEDAIYPVRQVGIPINIRNTNRPEDPGTLIISSNGNGEAESDVTGIAGRKDFVIITIEKALMHSETGFVRRLLSILEEEDISFEHMPSGIDSVSLVISECQLKGKLETVIAKIDKRLEPDKVEVFHEIALIATVGRRMVYKKGIAARLFTALAESGINIRLIAQGSSEMNIIIGIENKDFDQAVKSIYNAFVN